MTPEDIRLVPFFWSVRRQRYWKRCRRRYFLHYYLAYLGKHGDETPECIEAADLDRRVSAKAYVRIMLCRAMYEMFNSGENGSVAVAASLNFKHEVHKMMMYPDSVPQIISEIADGAFSEDYTLKDVADDILKGGQKIDENFWLKIQHIPMFYRKSVERPQRISFMELGCCFVPVLVFSNHGEIWILESSSVDNSGDMIACLHRMWVCNDLRRDPTKVRSLYLDENYEIKQLDDLPSVSAFLEEIRQDIHDMVEAEMEGYVTLHDFPPSPGPGCSMCQFFQFCNKRGAFKTGS